MITHFLIDATIFVEGRKAVVDLSEVAMWVTTRTSQLINVDRKFTLESKHALGWKTGPGLVIAIN